MPRLVNLALAIIGLIVTAPLVLLSAIAVGLTSRGPAIFRQARMGQKGRPFTLYKLRTMCTANDGPGVTRLQDQRITPVGRFLRKTKIDELPELWNVAKGDMALVGPRPEVPRYVDLTNPKWVVVLTAKPGITDPVTMRLRNEENLLGMVEGDHEQFYLNVLQPLKLDGYMKYLNERNWRLDLSVLWETAVAIVFPSARSARTLEDLSAQGLEFRN